MKKESQKYGLDECIAISQEAFNIARKMLPSSSNRYEHLPKIVDRSVIKVLTDREMYDLAFEKEQDGAMAKGANGYYFYDKNDPEFFDKIVVKESSLTPLVVLHEYVHRATSYKYLHGLKITEVNREVRRKLLPTAREKMENEDKANVKQKAASARAKCFSEGVVHWTTRELLAQIDEKYLAPDFPFDNHLKHILSSLRYHIISRFIKKGFSQSESELMIYDVALTGDLTAIDTAVRSYNKVDSSNDVNDAARLYDEIYYGFRLSKNLEKHPLLKR